MAPLSVAKLVVFLGDCAKKLSCESGRPLAGGECLRY
jgi:hypothetical protein